MKSNSLKAVILMNLFAGTNIFEYLLRVYKGPKDNIWKTLKAFASDENYLCELNEWVTHKDNCVTCNKGMRYTKSLKPKKLCQVGDSLLLPILKKLNEFVAACLKP